MKILTWAQRKLENLTNRVKSYSISHDAEVNQITGTKYIHYGDIHTGKVTRIQNESILPNIHDNNFVPLKNGDVIVADASEDYKGIADACVIDLPYQSYKIVSGLHTIAFRPNKELKPDFLYTYLHTSTFKHYGYRMGTGLKVFGISYKNLANMLIKLPDTKEQDKINKVLSLITYRIKLQQRKAQQLKLLKKAMMQDLFNDRDIPKLRFSGFKDNWSNVNLGEIGKATGGTPLESEFIKNGSYKVISIGSYTENHKYNNQGMRVNLNRKTKKRIMNKDDLAMILNDKTKSGKIIGSVLLISDNDSFVYNQRTERIEPNHDKFSSQFLFQYLNANTIRNKIVSNAQGNTQIYVNWSSISKINYLIPSIDEQKRIGKLLFSLDSIIDIQQGKIEKYYKVKQFLLQNMFI